MLVTKSILEQIEMRNESLKQSLSEYEMNRDEVRNESEYLFNVHHQEGMINGINELIQFLKGEINYTLQKVS
tara:strand:- start:1080 stop:1295 length:216 start_codon:yes stop_codon:yes gene_type:complete